MITTFRQGEEKFMFDVENHGSIMLIRPLGTDVKNWLDANTADDAQWFGGALVVEPRYVEALVRGLMTEFQCAAVA